MMACEDRPTATRMARVSLILPLVPGRSLSADALAEYRERLQTDGPFESVEVIVAGHPGSVKAGSAPDAMIEGNYGDDATYVAADGWGWSSIVRAGLSAATGDHFVVLDVGRHYSSRAGRGRRAGSEWSL